MRFDDQGREWLSEHVKERRVFLGYTQKGLGRACKLSGSQIGEIERRVIGALRPLSVQKLEHGLQWQKGSIEAILQGGEPVPIELSPVETRLAVLLAEADAEIQDEVHRCIDGLPEVQRLYGYSASLTAIERIIELLRRAHPVPESAPAE